MRDNWRSRLGVLAGAAALALPAATATPASAAEAPGLFGEVEMPAELRIVEGSPAAGPALPAPGAAEPAAAADTVGARSGPPSDVCLGATAAYGARGCFQHNGDIVWAGDTRKDGMSAAVGVYTDYGRAAEVCVNRLGVDTWATCDKDYRESGNVRLRVLRYDGDTGKFYQPEAWSGWIPVDGRY